MAGFEFFAGIDWGSETHQVCVVDSDGETLGQRAFGHTGAGLAEMADWLLGTTNTEPHAIAVAIEVPHGPVVETMMERGFTVHSVNPKQIDRFRDRWSPAGAKDDRRDAWTLADALRTDDQAFRRQNPQAPEVVELREWLSIPIENCTLLPIENCTLRGKESRGYRSSFPVIFMPLSGSVVMRPTSAERATSPGAPACDSCCPGC